MATVVPPSSTLSIWVIDSSDVSVPVNIRAAAAAARSGLSKRTVIVFTTRAVGGHGGDARPHPGQLVRPSGDPAGDRNAVHGLQVDQESAGQVSGCGDPPHTRRRRSRP
ncbi:hypothetical protein ACFZB5_33810 [Streptomyces nodosus]|uniref:hypothetical protein n=1 Tax=Streptomyces nodosus TaxID=40318 RepID=UPI0036E92577